MTPHQESALELCRRIEGKLREVQVLALEPGTETLAQCEAELTSIAGSLEEMRGSMAKQRAASAGSHNAAIGPVVQEIQRTARKLIAQFNHGSNYCMGILQMRLGTGYSQQGLPVLIASEARSTFEG